MLSLLIPKLLLPSYNSRIFLYLSLKSDLIPTKYPNSTILWQKEAESIVCWRKETWKSKNPTGCSLRKSERSKWRVCTKVTGRSRPMMGRIIQLTKNFIKRKNRPKSRYLISMTIELALLPSLLRPYRTKCSPWTVPSHTFTTSCRTVPPLSSNTLQIWT